MTGKTAVLIMIMILCAGSAGAIVIDGESIGAAVTEKLSSIAAEQGVDVEIETPLARDVIIELADEVSMQLEIPGDDPLGRRVPVKVAFIDPGGGTMRVTTVIAQVRTYSVAAVASSDMDGETPLSMGDIEFKRVDVTGIDGYLTPEAALDDLQTKRRIRAGTVLSEQVCEPIPLVRRGETVTINVNVGSVTITAEGVARQDGGRNEIIRVFTESTNKTITCRVLEPGLVIASR